MRPFRAARIHIRPPTVAAADNARLAPDGHSAREAPAVLLGCGPRREICLSRGQTAGAPCCNTTWCTPAARWTAVGAGVPVRRRDCRRGRCGA